MRIVYLSQSIIPSRSANSIQVMKMCQAFAGLGHRVLLLSPRQIDREEGVEDPFGFYGTDQSFEIAKIPFPKAVKGSLVYAAASAARARRENPDLVYGRFLPGTALACLWGRDAVFEAHRPVWQQGWVSRLLFRCMVRSDSFRRLVVITEALRKDFHGKNLAPLEKIRVVPDSADEPRSACSLSHWPGRREALQAGYAGNLHPGKGVEIVLDLARAMPAVDFHVLGGSEQSIQTWREKGLPGNLYLHGFVPPSQVPAFLSRLDVCLLPVQRYSGTYMESEDARGPNIADFTSPLKMFEYMAHGKAIIASDLPVLREILNEKNAVLVKSEDIGAWRAAVETLQNEKARRSISARAREDFVRSYSWKRRAERVLEGVFK